MVLTSAGVLAFIAFPLLAQDGVGTPQPLPTQTPYPTHTPYPQATLMPVAPPPTPPAPRPIPGLDAEIMRQADEQINTVLLAIERLQSAREAAGAPLLQLPSTHVAPPAVDARAIRGTPPDLNRRIGINSWYSAAVEVPAEMLARVRVDVYDGPHGHGYVLVCEMAADGKNYIRQINIGPETWRGHDWELVDD